VLADRKGYYVEPIRDVGLDMWRIRVARDSVEILVEIFSSKTYAEAESKARQYLNGLPDKEAK